MTKKAMAWMGVSVGLLLALGLLIVFGFACAVWIPKSLYPSLTASDLQGVTDPARVQDLKDARLKLQNDARTTWLQGYAALLVQISSEGFGRRFRSKKRVGVPRTCMAAIGRTTRRPSTTRSPLPASPSGRTA
jgi:hypothetical protein